MTINLDSLFKNSDPIISEILNNALSDKEISVKEGIELYNVDGADFHLIGLVADEIRRRRVGDARACAQTGHTSAAAQGM